MPDPKTNEEEKSNLPDEVTKVLEELKTKLDDQNRPPKEETSPPEPSASNRRASLQQSLGFTDEQMAAHEQSIMAANAPIIEQTGWSKLEKRSDIEKYRKEIESELAIYPQERRTPDIMEKIYYYVKGKHSDSQPAADPKKTPVVSTRVSQGPGYTGQEGGMGAREEGAPAGEEEQLTDAEKFVVQKLREAGEKITDKEYAMSKKVGRSIRELRVPDTRQVNSLADVELRRLQNR